MIYGSAELSYEDYNQAIAIDGIDGKFAPYGSTAVSYTHLVIALIAMPTYKYISNREVEM